MAVVMGEFDTFEYQYQLILLSQEPDTFNPILLTDSILDFSLIKLKVKKSQK